MYHVGGNLFFKLTTYGAIDRSGRNERQLLGLDQDEVPTSKVFVRKVVVLFLALYRVFKSMELLCFDSPAETDVVIRFHTSEKVFVSTLAGNRPRDLPQGNHML